MATSMRQVNSNEEFRTSSSDRLYSVVRQPVLDLNSRVYAYELRWRGVSQLGGDKQAANCTLAETMAFFGLQRPSELKKLTGRMTAFVDCPEEALNDGLGQVLPSTLTVIQLPATLEISAGLVSTCQDLKALGFRLAMDHLSVQPQLMPLLELADYVKVDFRRTLPFERREALESMHGKTIPMLAMNIDTQAEYRKAREDGFALIEGYYFCESVPMRNRRPPVNQILRIDILKSLQQSPLDSHKVSQLVTRDGPITYQLLRLVNSPLLALPQVVNSIEAALLIVGDDAFRRIATAAIASEFCGGQPSELLCLAMVRARFCEMAGHDRNLAPFGQYLLGLLSLLPAMQGQSMSDVVPTLPLDESVRNALLGSANPERVLLGWLEYYERGDWAGCDAAAKANNLNQQELAKLYVDAVAWTESALHTPA